MEFLIAILVVLVAIGLAWKLLKGVAKTAALVVILIVAALYVFGVQH